MLRKLKRKYWYPISVSIELTLRKIRIAIDRFYRKTWVYIYILIMLPFVLFAAYRMHYDYTLIHNYANLDAPFAPIYTEWNTEGKPGENPPPFKACPVRP
jgi:hypothetical protein